MKKIILIPVFSFIAISAMCQKMESAGSTIDGRPAAPKAATVLTGKAYPGYVAPAAQPKQVTTTQPAKPIEKPIVLPSGGNIGNAEPIQVKQNTKVEAIKVQGTSLDLTVPKAENQKTQPVETPSSTTTIIKKG